MNWDAIIDNGLKIVAVFALVLLNGFFVAAELALVRVRDTQLAALVAKGNRRAKIAREIVGNIDGYIGATQFGITIASMALGVVVAGVSPFAQPVVFGDENQCAGNPAHGGDPGRIFRQ
jgi:CBS domain containing-hemolysin-like protein